MKPQITNETLVNHETLMIPRGIGWNRRYMVEPQVLDGISGIGWNCRYRMEPQVYLQVTIYNVGMDGTSGIGWNARYRMEPQVQDGTLGLGWNPRYRMEPEVMGGNRKQDHILDIAHLLCIPYSPQNPNIQHTKYNIQDTTYKMQHTTHNIQYTINIQSTSYNL